MTRSSTARPVEAPRGSGWRTRRTGGRSPPRWSGPTGYGITGAIWRTPRFPTAHGTSATRGRVCTTSAAVGGDVETILSHSFTAFASDGDIVVEPERGGAHPRSFGMRARVLGRYVRERGTLWLEDAVRRMTSLPRPAFLAG